MDTLIPVICDRCRAEGLAGEDPFLHLADLLSFAPVPRRAHANGWSPEVQRAFIAAVVVTGSPRRAARAIGRHAFGAEQLRKARGGSSFAAAWDAALDLARERELAGLHDGLTELAAENDEERHRRRCALVPAAERSPQESVRPERVEGRSPAPRDPHNDEDWFSPESRQEYLDSQAAVRDRLTRARRLLLFLIRDDEARRAAWETLVGPVDWAKAERLEPQADEPFAARGHVGGYANPHNFRNPDMLLTAEAGLLAEFTGGEDALEEIREAVDQARAEDCPSPLSGPTAGPRTTKAICGARANDSHLQNPSRRSPRRPGAAYLGTCEHRALVAAGLRAPNALPSAVEGMREFGINDDYAWELFRPPPSMLPKLRPMRYPPVERDG